MRALVTGAAGFVGRHMMAELAQRGWHVTGVDIRDQEWSPIGGNPGIFIKIDARRIFAGGIIPHERCDLVVHCAYHVGGRKAIDSDSRLLAWNLELDAQMFDWAIRTEQPRVLYFSSSAAYPIEYQQADRWVRLAEDHINLSDVRQPDARYGWAKLTGEQLAASAALAGVRVHVMRPFSGYGGDQDLTYPFPAILDRVRRGDLSVWGPPGQCRDWVHIDDVVGCSLAAVEQDIAGPLNICSGTGVEMGDLAARMAAIVGVAAQESPRYLVDQPTGVMMRIGDPSRMHAVYQPKVGLDEGIRRALRLKGRR